MIYLYSWLAFLAVVYIAMGIEALWYSRKMRWRLQRIKEAFLEEED